MRSPFLPRRSSVAASSTCESSMASASYKRILITSLCTEHKTGQVILISLRHLQAEAGVSFDLLGQPQTVLSYLTGDCWILSLRRYCAEDNISLRTLNNKFSSPSQVLFSVLCTVPKHSSTPSTPLQYEGLCTSLSKSHLIIKLIISIQ